MGLDAAFIWSKSATLEIDLFLIIFNALSQLSRAWDAA